jgi:hypothetical protein
VNTTPRRPIPQHDHYAELRYPSLLGDGVQTIGPFATLHAVRRAVSAARAPYPGGYQPSFRIYAVVRDDA